MSSFPKSFLIHYSSSSICTKCIRSVTRGQSLILHPLILHLSAALLFADISQPCQSHNPVFHIWLGLVRIINKSCIYGIIGREITKYAGIYGVYIRFWPAYAKPIQHLISHALPCISEVSPDGSRLSVCLVGCSQMPAVWR